MFNRKKKTEKFLNERKERIETIGLENLKAEPFVLEPTDIFPMFSQISLAGTVKSGMYHYGDPIGIKTGGQTIHSKSLEMRIPGIKVSNEELDNIYKDDYVELIFNDIVAQVVDKDAVAVADPWNEIHKEEM